MASRGGRMAHVAQTKGTSQRSAAVSNRSGRSEPARRADAPMSQGAQRPRGHTGSAKGPSNREVTARSRSSKRVAQNDKESSLGATPISPSGPRGFQRVEALVGPGPSVGLAMGPKMDIPGPSSFQGTALGEDLGKGLDWVAESVSSLARDFGMGDLATGVIPGAASEVSAVGREAPRPAPDSFVTANIGPTSDPYGRDEPMRYVDDYNRLYMDLHSFESAFSASPEKLLRRVFKRFSLDDWASSPHLYFAVAKPPAVSLETAIEGMAKHAKNRAPFDKFLARVNEWIASNDIGSPPSRDAMGNSAVYLDDLGRVFPDFKSLDRAYRNHRKKMSHRYKQVTLPGPLDGRDLRTLYRQTRAPELSLSDTAQQLAKKSGDDTDALVLIALIQDHDAEDRREKEQASSHPYSSSSTSSTSSSEPSNAPSTSSDWGSSHESSWSSDSSTDSGSSYDSGSYGSGGD